MATVAWPVRKITPAMSGKFSADFWRLWSVGLIAAVVRWLETVVVGVVVYRETGSPFVVSLVTMLRLVPMGLFGAVLGAVVERVDRRRLLAVTMVLLALTSMILAIVAAFGVLQVWHLAVGALLNGFSWLTDNPLRRTMMGDSVDREKLSSAMAIDILSQNASRMVGPTLGGLMLVLGGIEGTFLLCASLYLLAVGATLSVRRYTLPVLQVAPVLAQVRDGLAAALADRRIVAILAVTVVFNVFGLPFVSMIPVIGRDELGLGPHGVGLLASIDGVGALATALLLAWRLPVRWHARAYIGGGALYQVAVAAFALAPGVVTASVALLLTGVAGAAYATLQVTLVYLASPPAMRSRIMGVLTVCIGTAPLGFLGLGWLADRVGAPGATAIIGGLGLAVLLALAPLLRKI